MDKPGYIQEIRNIIGGSYNELEPTTTSSSAPNHIAEIKEILSKGMQAQDKPPNVKERNLNFWQRGLQAASGAPKFLGDLADLGSLASNKVFGTSYTPGKFGKLAEKPFSALAGVDISPQNPGEKFTQEIGSFALPLGGALKLAGTGIKAAKGAVGLKALGSVAKETGKNFIKNIPHAAGASAALNLTPHLTDDDNSLGRFAEDLVKTIIGGKVGEKIVNTGSALGRASTIGVKAAGESFSSGHDVIDSAKAGIDASLEKIKNNYHKKVTEWLAKGKPNAEVLKYAKEHGIELPFNVGLGSRFKNFLVNNLFKSTFTNQAYNDVVEKANRQMMDAVERQIASLGDAKLYPHEASAQFMQHLGSEKKIAKEISEKLYDEAQKLIKDSDVVMPTRTAALIKDIHHKILNDSYNPGEMSKVASALSQISKELGIITPKDLKKINWTPATNEFELEGQKKLLNHYINELSNSKTTPLKKMLGIKRALGKATGYSEQDGYINLLNGLRESVTADLNASSNKEFLRGLKIADDNFKQEIINRFRTDIAESIMKGTPPKDAYSLINNRNLPYLKAAAGKTPKGEAILNQMLESKAREILNTSIGANGLNHQSFVNFMSKRTEQTELLRNILGQESFKKLKEISQISKQIAKDNKVLLNSSGTAHVLGENAKLGKLSASAVDLIVGTFALILGGKSSSLGGAALAMGTVVSGGVFINGLSKFLADPKTMSLMRDYAISSASGNAKKANGIMKRLVDNMAPIAENAVKSAAHGASTQHEQQ